MVEHTVTSNPTWSQVEEAIAALDGESRSWVALEVPGKGASGSLAITGGNSGCHLVMYMIDMDTQATLMLTNPSQTGPEVWVVMQGTGSYFPARWGVSKQLALDAAEHFFRTGQLADHLSWDVSS